MLYTVPDYYDHFQCAAGECPDTCCGNWQIVLDEESLSYYKSCKGELGHQLKKNINWKEKVFRQNKERRCLFLQEDLLCSLQCALGGDKLCKTCREYPRHTEEFENVRERSLSLSCPEVAKMFLTLTKPVTFRSWEDDTDECFEEFDYFLYDELVEIREHMLGLMQNRDLPIGKRLEQVLAMGIQVQALYEEGNLILWREATGAEDSTEEAARSQDSAKEAARSQSSAEEATGKKFNGALSSYQTPATYLQLQGCFDFLFELERLLPHWEIRLLETKQFLFSLEEKDFWDTWRQMQNWWAQTNLLPLEILLEQIGVYFLWVYFPGAVYDENMEGKVQASVYHCAMLSLLLLGRWKLNEGFLSQEEIIELLYEYAREIEHSDENLNLVEELRFHDFASQS